ncbi:MAG: hypothetical protein ABH833_03185 [Parcubacteria group bacterium]
MIKKNFSIILLLVSISVVGCATATYHAGNEIFYSSAEALQRLNEISSSILAGIQPTDHPVHGRALFLLPSDNEIQKNYIRWSNNASRLEKEQVDYTITFIRNDKITVADAARKRGIFDSVEIEKHNGSPTTHPIGIYDFMVFLDVDGWFIKGKTDSKILKIFMDKSKSSGITRTISVLDSIQKQAESLIKQ